jgi:hypothetical protein
MGDGDKRPSKRIVRYDSRELARLSKRHVPTEAEWDEKVASGAPKDASAALVSRTATLDDPLTTSLLAEIARRSMTIEVSPDQIDEAMELEPGDRATVASDRAAATATDDPSDDPA